MYMILQNNTARTKLKIPLFWLIATILLNLSAGGHAQGLDADYQISALGPGDQNFLRQQQELAESLVYEHLLSRLNGDQAHDIALLQRLLDKDVLRAEQRRELQALGVVLGRLLEKEFRLRWVVYIDELGRSRGLQVDNTTQVIFPLTMVSRRVEADAAVDVNEIYTKASDIVRYTRANLPLFTQ